MLFEEVTIPLPSVAPARRLLSTLQIGNGWFTEQAGGLERVYQGLIQELPRHGVSCRGLVVGSPAVAEQTNGRVTAFAPASAPLLQRWKLARRAVDEAIESDAPDLVVSHFALYGFAVLNRIRHLPLVVHFQGPMAAEARLQGGGRLGSLAKFQMERRVYRRADRLIVLCDAFRDILVSDYGVDADRIRVLPPGIDCARFDIPETRREAREKLGWPTDRPIVLCVRRLTHRMGLENLIDAAAELRKSNPDVLILVAGRGPLRKALSNRIRQHGLEPTVRLLGFVSDADLPLAYRAADLSVVPTIALEGFGLVAAESLAAGTPAIVTPVDGLPSVVEGLSRDLILSGVDRGALAAGIRNALQNFSPLPTEHQCRNYVVAHFDWRVIASRS